MVVRVGPRIEVRLDEAHREKLARVLEARGETISAFVRAAIDEANEAIEMREFDALLKELQDTATWTPTEEELHELLDEPQCPELDESVG